MSDTPGAARPGRWQILVVCTANQCRSPMADRLLRAELDHRGITAEVSSAGILEGGAPASPGSVKAMARAGIDLTDHVSRQLDGDIVDDADLIITMERRHLTIIGELSPAAARRSFTIKEIARLAPGVPSNGDLRAWVAAAQAARPNAAAIGLQLDDDLDDPMGRSARRYRRTADELTELVAIIVRSAFPR